MTSFEREARMRELGKTSKAAKRYCDIQLDDWYMNCYVRGQHYKQHLQRKEFIKNGRVLFVKEKDARHWYMYVVDLKGIRRFIANTTYQKDLSIAWYAIDAMQVIINQTLKRDQAID